MSEASPSIQSVTDGGITAEHVVLPVPPALVAATNSGNEHNTIRSSIVPFACWRANDMRFEFESSFVRHEITEEIGALKELIDRHTLTDQQGKPAHPPVLTVFGHADPTGNDDFNKQLSGRRAQAVYGMLTRETDLWEDLFAHPLGNDNWSPKAILAMQTALGRDADPKPSSSTRKALYRDYMDSVCTSRDEQGQPVKDANGQIVRLEVRKVDFLSSGSDDQHKGDFQGCGEFNPITVFSKEEEKQFSKPDNKEARNTENATNRRVVIFLFRPEVHVRPADWPCPRAKEGVGACRKRFWSDGEKRRSPQDQRRDFQDTGDTFGCRFYDRLSNNSPCERGLASFAVRVYDTRGIRIPEAPFEAIIGLRKPVKGVASPEGLVSLQDVEVPNKCVINWGFKPEKGAKPELVFTLEMFLTHDDLARDDEARQKLHNLGYPKENDLATSVTEFQRDYGRLVSPALKVDGSLDTDPRTFKLIQDVYEDCAPDLRNTPPA